MHTPGDLNHIILKKVTVRIILMELVTAANISGLARSVELDRGSATSAHADGG